MAVGGGTTIHDSSVMSPTKIMSMTVSGDSSNTTGSGVSGCGGLSPNGAGGRIGVSNVSPSLSSSPSPRNAAVAAVSSNVSQPVRTTKASRLRAAALGKFLCILHVFMQVQGYNALQRYEFK